MTAWWLLLNLLSKVMTSTVSTLVSTMTMSVNSLMSFSSWHDFP